MATRAAAFVALAGLMLFGCEGAGIVGGPGRHSPRVAVPSSPALYRSPTGSDAQPWELPDLNGATSMLEPVPAMDPVLAFPSNHLWRELWFPIENPPRDRMESPGIVQQMINARPGMHIADVGAGGGYFSFRFARDVGDLGHVWSIDIDGRATSKIAWEAHARGVSNVTAVRVRRGALGLDELSLDAVAMLETGALNTCEPEEWVRYVEQIALALRPGGRFVFQDVSVDVNNSDAAGRHGRCRAPTANEVIALVRPFFDLVRREDVITGTVWRSYILQLRRR
jgi:SAM-dependent methyltransferase